MGESQVPEQFPNPPSFADLCRRAADVACGREMPLPTVEQSVVVAKAAAAGRAKIGRSAASCYILIGHADDKDQERAIYQHAVLVGLASAGFRATSSLTSIVSGRNVFARVILEW